MKKYVALLALTLSQPAFAIHGLDVESYQLKKNASPPVVTTLKTLEEIDACLMKNFTGLSWWGKSLQNERRDREGGDFLYIVYAPTGPAFTKRIEGTILVKPYREGFIMIPRAKAGRDGAGKCIL